MKKQTDDNEYVRVTQVLAPYSDFSKIPEETLRAASERGTLVHDFCKLYALDSLIEPVPEKIKGYFDSFKMWFDEHVQTVILAEERIYDDELMLSGEPDLVCTLRDDSSINVLIDYKTPAQAYKTWALQTAAYAKLLREKHGIYIRRRLAVQLKKDGSYPTIIEYASMLDEILFMNAFALHAFFNS